MQHLEWLEQVSEFVKDGIFLIKGTPPRIVFCNTAACEHAGYDRSELIGSPPGVFLGGRPGENAKVELDDSLWRNLPAQMRIRNYRKDGQAYQVYLGLHSLPAAAGGERCWIGLQVDLSKNRALKKSLAQAKFETSIFERRLWDAVNALPDAFVMYDRDDRLVACNEKYKEFYAASADAIQPGASFHDIIRFGLQNGQYPEAVGREDEWFEEWQGRHRKPTKPIERDLPNGRYIVLHDVITESGDLVGLRTDVSELRQQKKRLEEQKKFVELLLNRNPAIIMSQGRDWKIQTCSDAWTEQFGYSREETVGRDLTEFMPEEDAEESKAFRQDELQSKQVPSIIKNVLKIKTKSGEARSVELQSVIENHHDVWLNLIAMVDITPIIQARDELEWLVEHDELTGLLSRRGQQTHFADGKRKSDVGLFLIDVDYFKSVNYGYGYEAGDSLLKAIAECLSTLTAEVGCPIRLGGEKFAVVRPWAGWPEAEAFAEELRSSLEKISIVYRGQMIQRSASIGYVEVRIEDELTVANQLADLALREAKSSGRNKSLPADTKMLRKLEERGATIRNDQVQTALEGGEFFYQVQPIIHAGSGRVVGCEALIRWLRPGGEIVMPNRFIDALHEVIRQSYFSEFKNRLRADVLEKLTDFEGKYIGFNFILEEIAFPGAAEKIVEIFGDVAASAKQKILIEISEKTIYSRLDTDILVQELQKLRDNGYLIALDDFGVESSNIQRLQQFPIDIVKLDKSLICEIVDSEKQRMTVLSIARMIENLGMTCIVEGVETEQEAEILQGMGLFLHQGFFHAMPCAPLEMVDQM